MTGEVVPIFLETKPLFAWKSGLSLTMVKQEGAYAGRDVS